MKNIRKELQFSLATLSALGLLSLTGCTTQGYCFDNCGDQSAAAGSTGSSGSAGSAGSAGSVQVGGSGGGIQIGGSGGSGGGCSQTNGGIEICDGLDNDCNDIVDDGFDLKDPKHCGSCTNNCFTLLSNADPTSVNCSWSGKEGDPGICGFSACAQDWFDIDKDPSNGCEYPCVKTADDDKSCNNKDDNCNGEPDEDVDLCTSVTDCGQCGGACVVLHGTPECVHEGQGACDVTNTQCTIAKCDDGFFDLDKSYATGCEYQCTKTGDEVCGDGVDNDCDGLIDAADPDVANDPQINQPCFGGAEGECATQAHVGKTVCQGQQVVCVGDAVLQPGQNPEVCDGIDNDCDGTVDNSPTDAGKPCGTSALFPCALGVEQCVNGALACIGAVEPGPELCNGLDDNCNGQIDDAPIDSVGECGQSNVGTCKFGQRACVGGQVVCQGKVDAVPETCNGLDDDCDGIVDNNPTDVGGSCGQSGIAPCKLGTYTCVNGALQCNGNIDPSAETCDGLDNDCNGTIDDNTPGSGVACGTSDVAPCQKGTMQCVGATMLCVGAIEPKAETCNGLDDNCNGFIDDSPSDAGGSCGLSNKAPCKLGVLQCQNGVLACAGNVDPKPETCDGVDNDCNGTIDDNPSGVNADCGTSNKAPCKLGKTACQNGALACVGAVNPSAETCDGIDNDCNGTIDDNPSGVGQSCGASNVFPCQLGLTTCKSGKIECNGNVDPKPEVCDGVDNDCDGKIDLTGSNPPSDSVGSCNVPPAAPPGATSPCKAGTKACQGGTVQCVGSVTPAPGSQDTCGVDANCDGVLTNQPDTKSDVNNCGGCGISCYTGAVHSNWSCVNNACVFQGCQTGYYDNGGPGDAVAGDNKCGYACTFVSSQEACNGQDDNCNGTIDENPQSKPSPVQLCGVSPQATRPECTTGVTVACTGGAWKCTFPANVCSPTCATAAETCDSLDNNCNGLLNENVANFGKACASDDAAPGTHGVCRTTGTYVCNGPNAVACSAVKADCNSLPGGCTELCDGKDNDCDGLVDETYQSKGSNAVNFVKPAVTKIASNLWIYSHEASRPNATNIAPGSGNGFWCGSAPCPGSTPAAPAGETLDKTKACSVQGRIPWFNVSPIEAEQTCQAMGGRICTTTEWQSACTATASCGWGYATRGAACTSSFTGSKFCNIGPSFDFDPGLAGDQDGLLVTGSSSLQNCFADWSNLQGNTAASNKIFDITGNLREITKDGSNIYPLMGGSFDTEAEGGAACSFDFFAVDQNFKLYETGFRCCFSSDPTQ